MCVIKANVIKALECPISGSVLFGSKDKMGQNLLEQFMKNERAQMVSVDMTTKEISKVDKDTYPTLDSLKDSNLSYVVFSQESGSSLVYSVAKDMFKLC